MEPIYQQDFLIDDACVDRYGRLKPSMILFFAQEVAGEHCKALSVGCDRLSEKHLIWAISRHRLQISRLPMAGEVIHVETWPMPTTRVAYPRSVVAYDQAGEEVFRSISLWVLMDDQTRTLILPGKSGITVPGTLRGTELAAPRSVLPTVLKNHTRRTVLFTDLDRNGHMNNTRYLDWINDLLPSPFHAAHTIKEMTICYHNEAPEGLPMDLSWEIQEGPVLRVDAFQADQPDCETRIFMANVVFR